MVVAVNPSPFAPCFYVRFAFSPSVMCTMSLSSFSLLPLLLFLSFFPVVASCQAQGARAPLRQSWGRVFIKPFLPSPFILLLPLHPSLSPPPLCHHRRRPSLIFLLLFLPFSSPLSPSPFLPEYTPPFSPLFSLFLHTVAGHVGILIMACRSMFHHVKLISSSIYV